jgi:hypothetical protein
MYNIDLIMHCRYVHLYVLAGGKSAGNGITT